MGNKINDGVDMMNLFSKALDKISDVKRVLPFVGIILVLILAITVHFGSKLKSEASIIILILLISLIAIFLILMTPKILDANARANKVFNEGLEEIKEKANDAEKSVFGGEE